MTKIKLKAEKTNKSLRQRSKRTKTRRKESFTPGQLTEAQILKQRQKRVRSKAITHRIAKEQLNIIENDNEGRDSLIKRMNCNNILIHDTTGNHSNRCEKRTCIYCSNIRTMQRINKYKPIIERWPEIWLVTLTTKNVKEELLRPTLDRLNKSIRLTTNNYRSKYKNDYLKYIRSTEITVNDDMNEYHPHSHSLTSSYDEAKYMVDQHLNHFKSESVREAQDIRRADINSLTEIFKYVAKPYKIAPRLLNEKTITLTVNPYHLNIIEKATNDLKLSSSSGVKRYAEEASIDYKKHIQNEKNYKLKEDYKESQTIPKGLWNWDDEENMYKERNKENYVTDKKLCEYKFTSTYKFKIKNNIPGLKSKEKQDPKIRNPEITNTEIADLKRIEEEQEWKKTILMFKEMNEVYNSKNKLQI